MKTKNIFTALLVSGIGIADLAAVGVLFKEGGFKFFGGVLAGLAAATVGGLGLMGRGGRQ